MASEKDQALIDKHLLGTISPAEAENFTQRLNDPAFAAELAFRKDLLEAIKAEGREQLRTELQALETEEKTDLVKAAKQRPLYWWIGLAAAAVIALVFLFRLVLTEPVNSQALFAQHFEPYPNVERVITRNQQNAESLDMQAYANYELGRYQEAVLLFDQLIAAEPENLSHRFYRALANLTLDQAASAIPELKKVAQSDTSRYASAANWFLALAYLQKERLEEARSLLDQISKQSQHPYHEEALALLQQID
jgi:tetratricopeptide (TPR) repeat protein